MTGGVTPRKATLLAFAFRSFCVSSVIPTTLVCDHRACETVHPFVGFLNVSGIFVTS